MWKGYWEIYWMFCIAVSVGLKNEAGLQVSPKLLSRDFISFISKVGLLSAKGKLATDRDLLIKCEFEKREYTISLSYTDTLIHAWTQAQTESQECFIKNLKLGIVFHKMPTKNNALKITCVGINNCFYHECLCKHSLPCKLWKSHSSRKLTFHHLHSLEKVTQKMFSAFIFHVVYSEV